MNLLYIKNCHLIGTEVSQSTFKSFFNLNLLIKALYVVFAQSRVCSMKFLEQWILPIFAHYHQRLSWVNIFLYHGGSEKAPWRFWNIVHVNDLIEAFIIFVILILNHLFQVGMLGALMKVYFFLFRRNLLIVFLKNGNFLSGSWLRLLLFILIQTAMKIVDRYLY